MPPTLRVACIQAEPAVLDAKASLAKACDLVREAAGQGARLAVFPEAFVAGYPQWAHSARFEEPAHKAAHARFVRHAVRVPGDLGAVAEAARRHGVAVVLPVTERDAATPGTVYNTFAVFDERGAFLGKHRKLVPTHHERTAYGQGTGETLRAFDVAGGEARIGGLICWNNFMPLARHALYREGVQVWLAPTADDLPSWQVAMQYLARESRCFVVAPCLLQRKAAFPQDWELRTDPAWQREPEWNERGGSCILGPDGAYLAEPVVEEERVLVADLDLERVVAERQTFDPAGHYSGGDVFRFAVRGRDAAA